MRQCSSGITRRVRRPGFVVPAALLALLPAAAAAQEVHVERSEAAADRAFRYTPPSLMLELTPFALGDSVAGSRLGVNAAAGGSVALGVHKLVRGTQLGVYYGNTSFGSLHREAGSAFGVMAGRPLLSGQFTPRLGWTVGVAGSVGIRPSSELFGAGSGSAAVAVPFSARLRLREARATDEQPSWRSAWRFAPAIALYAAPTLAFGVQGASERTFLDATYRTPRSRELLPQLQLGARLEGLGPIHLQLGWRYSPRLEHQAGSGMTAALGFTIR